MVVIFLVFSGFGIGVVLSLIILFFVVWWMLCRGVEMCCDYMVI